MKIGDYVRTENGIITKYHPQCVELNKFENRYYYVYEDEIEYYDHKDLIVKSSPSIIDLIEVGDYVNGKKVTSIEIDDYKSYNINNNGWNIIDIKSIVTKEMFESMEYKINE